MKILFRLNSLFIALVLLSTLLVSCSKDDNASPSLSMDQLYGQWVVKGIYEDGVNILSEYGYSNVHISEITDMHKELHNAEGVFAAALLYKSDFSDHSISSFGGYCKLTSSNVMRITTDFEMHPFDIKIKKSTKTELIFEYEDDEMGWLEVHCVPFK